MFDSLGDRMKFYEENNSPRILLNTLPTIVRLDGKAFHTFTRGLEWPCSKFLISMRALTSKLVEETNAIIGYTQSDEISLILYSENWKSEIYFNGKRDKINSVLASYATTWFQYYIEFCLPEKAPYRPLFDCRSFQVPSKWEACNYLIWREQDCTRNSVQSLARKYFSHNQCNNKNNSQLQDMLMLEHGVNWNELSPLIKRGYYIDKYDQWVYPILSTIENLDEVIFNQQEIILKD